MVGGRGPGGLLGTAPLCSGPLGVPVSGGGEKRAGGAWSPTAAAVMLGRERPAIVAAEGGGSQ